MAQSATESTPQRNANFVFNSEGSDAHLTPPPQLPEEFPIGDSEGEELDARLGAAAAAAPTTATSRRGPR